MIKDAPIVILDEATSNIDISYNKFLFQYWVNSFNEKTFVIITHKKENLREVDFIYNL